ncbi:hypothetical protein [Parabacteroides distasonis]|uniref:Uncharacterized protein n=2 Tax=Parabacteroides distasonis TaxID=823 RepID=A0A1Y4IQF0_PARDI|nr:hypothetical protein [Parabacteroides distasonis]MDB9162273.1 hypothetical protein [Parabacteroides distasonis]OUP21180.1 hypothetical protein B5F32_05065 [Parabacteroides distasonis]
MLPIGSEEQVIQEMRSLIPQSLPTEVRERLEKELASKKLKEIHEIYDYDRYLSDGENGLLEEFACDLQAWNLIIQQLKGSGCPEENILNANIWVFMSLNIMDYDKFLNTLYKDSCTRKEEVNPCTAVLRHSFLRGYIYTCYDKCY